MDTADPQSPAAVIELVRLWPDFVGKVTLDEMQAGLDYLLAAARGVVGKYATQLTLGIHAYDRRNRNSSVIFYLQATRDASQGELDIKTVSLTVNLGWSATGKLLMALVILACIVDIAGTVHEMQLTYQQGRNLRTYLAGNYERHLLTWHILDTLTQLATVSWILMWFRLLWATAYEEDTPYPQSPKQLAAVEGWARLYTGWLYFSMAVFLLVGLRGFQYLKYHPGLKIFYTVFRLAYRDLLEFTTFVVGLAVLLCSAIFAIFMISGGNSLFAVFGRGLSAMARLSFGFMDYDKFVSDANGLGKFDGAIVFFFWISVLLLVLVVQNTLLAIFTRAYESAKSRSTGDNTVFLLYAIYDLAFYFLRIRNWLLIGFWALVSDPLDLDGQVMAWRQQQQQQQLQRLRLRTAAAGARGGRSVPGVPAANGGIDGGTSSQGDGESGSGGGKVDGSSSDACARRRRRWATWSVAYHTKFLTSCVRSDVVVGGGSRPPNNGTGTEGNASGVGRGYRYWWNLGYKTKLHSFLKPAMTTELGGEEDGQQQQRQQESHPSSQPPPAASGNQQNVTGGGEEQHGKCFNMLQLCYNMLQQCYNMLQKCYHRLRQCCSKKFLNKLAVRVMNRIHWYLTNMPYRLQIYTLEASNRDFELLAVDGGLKPYQIRGPKDLYRKAVSKDPTQSFSYTMARWRVASSPQMRALVHLFVDYNMGRLNVLERQNQQEPLAGSTSASSVSPSTATGSPQAEKPSEAADNDGSWQQDEAADLIEARAAYSMWRVKLDPDSPAGRVARRGETRQWGPVKQMWPEARPASDGEAAAGMKPQAQQAGQQQQGQQTEQKPGQQERGGAVAAAERPTLGIMELRFYVEAYESELMQLLVEGPCAVAKGLHAQEQRAWQKLQRHLNQGPLKRNSVRAAGDATTSGGEAVQSHADVDVEAGGAGDSGDGERSGGDGGSGAAGGSGSWAWLRAWVVWVAELVRKTGHAVRLWSRPNPFWPLMECVGLEDEDLKKFVRALVAVYGPMPLRTTEDQDDRMQAMQQLQQWEGMQHILQCVDNLDHLSLLAGSRALSFRTSGGMGGKSTRTRFSTRKRDY